MRLRNVFVAPMKLLNCHETVQQEGLGKSVKFKTGKKCYKHLHLILKFKQSITKKNISDYTDLIVENKNELESLFKGL